MFEIKCQRVVVYQRIGNSDIVQIETLHSSPAFTFAGMKKGNLFVQFEASTGYGAEYVRNIFGVEPQVIRV